MSKEITMLNSLASNKTSALKVSVFWNVSREEIDEFVSFETKSHLEVANILGVDYEKYMELNIEDKVDYILRCIRRCPSIIDNLFDLPEEITVPECVEEDEIGEWLSDEFGFYHDGFEIVE